MINQSLSLPAELLLLEPTTLEFLIKYLVLNNSKEELNNTVSKRFHKCLHLENFLLLLKLLLKFEIITLFKLLLNYFLNFTYKLFFKLLLYKVVEDINTFR